MSPSDTSRRQEHGHGKRPLWRIGTQRILGAALLGTALLGAALLGAASSCTKEPQEQPVAPNPEPTADDALLTIDGITITFGDLAEGVAYFDSLNPNASKRTKMHRVLDELVLPLKFARHEFAAERQELLAQAVALRAIAGNVQELDEASDSELMIRRRKTVTPRDVEIPIARYLFDPTQIGGVSQPIEVPQGYVLAGAFDLEQMQLVLLDRCDALQVLFSNHDISAWRQWLGDLRARIADKVTYFHPDYRDAMPSWAQLP